MRLLAMLVIVLALTVATATADGRMDGTWCTSTACEIHADAQARQEAAKRRAVRRADPHWRLFRYWSRQPIADCTWIGESSPPGDYSGRFAARRYLVVNAGGSGARGKYQLMPGTYAAMCKLCDWSRADQEYAGHRLYRLQGTGPWAAC